MNTDEATKIATVGISADHGHAAMKPSGSAKPRAARRTMVCTGR